MNGKTSRMLDGPPASLFDIVLSTCAKGHGVNVSLITKGLGSQRSTVTLITNMVYMPPLAEGHK